MWHFQLALKVTQVHRMLINHISRHRFGKKTGHQPILLLILLLILILISLAE